MPEHERPAGRSSTSNSIASTPCSSAASNERSVFSGASRGGAAVPDADHPPVSAQQPHGGGRVGRKSSSSSPPRAAYSTIIRSVTHSTGARSSVHGRFAFVVTGRI